MWLKEFWPFSVRKIPNNFFVRFLLFKIVLRRVNSIEILSETVLLLFIELDIDDSVVSLRINESRVSRPKFPNYLNLEKFL